MAKNGRIKKKNPKIKALRRFAEKDNLKKDEAERGGRKDSVGEEEPACTE